MPYILTVNDEVLRHGLIKRQEHCLKSQIRWLFATPQRSQLNNVQFERRIYSILVALQMCFTLLAQNLVG